VIALVLALIIDLPLAVLTAVPDLIRLRDDRKAARSVPR
jgi:hypothetical protein